MTQPNLAASCDLHEEQKVLVVSTFQRAYFGTQLEQKVFTFLSSLAARNPFFDVVMTGHLFGAAMATIAGLRYATHNSQMRVSCHAFGSPRIGKEEWRQLVHSVPNLRVYRVENGSDPYVMLPSSDWVHCGHAIHIHDAIVYGKHISHDFKARRFIRDKTPPSSARSVFKLSPGTSSQGKIDHEIQSYVNRLTRSGELWFTDFCEVTGDGVNGANNEKRTVA